MLYHQTHPTKNTTGRRQQIGIIIQVIEDNCTKKWNVSEVKDEVNELPQRHRLGSSSGLYFPAKTRIGSVFRRLVCFGPRLTASMCPHPIKYEPVSQCRIHQGYYQCLNSDQTAIICKNSELVLLVYLQASGRSFPGEVLKLRTMCLCHIKLGGFHELKLRVFCFLLSTKRGALLVRTSIIDW